MTAQPSIYIILASASPRRAELLRSRDYDFEIRPSAAEEIEVSSGDARQIVEHNARAKCLDVANRLRHQGQWKSGTVVLGADTLVARHPVIYSKPRDLAEAHAFLAALGGVVHEVWTGICLYHLDSNQTRVHAECTRVTLRKMNEAQRDALFQRVNPLDKAGAYGFQDSPDIVDHLEGSVTNVIGLPMRALERVLTSLRNVT